MKSRTAILHNQIRSERRSDDSAGAEALRDQCCGSALDHLVVDAVQLRIFCRAAHQDAKIGNFVQREGGWRGGCGYGDEVGAVDFFEVKAGALVGYCGLNLDVAHFEVGDVAQEETL